jgi:hypothetical protein
MDYSDVRKKFAELSGRWDLLTSTYEDAGADFFLNAGQKYLDRMMDTGKMNARYPVIMAAGTIVAKTVGLRSIREVWVVNVDGKTQLSPCSLQMLREYYSEESANVAQGCPAYYAPAILRPFPDTLASTTGMYDVEDLLLYSGTAPAQHFNYNGIIVMPPPDSIYTLQIWGLFYSPTLSATLSGSVWTQVKSFWTEVHPEILIEAAIYKLHSLYNNTTAAADYKTALFEDVTGMNHDAADEDCTGSMVMGG